MKPKEDAFGWMLWAYYKGKEVYEIWERDDGHISASSDAPKKYFSEYQDWPLHEKRAMEFVRGRVLDLGCGAGRHSLYLQKKGFDVLGIDESPLAIEVSKLRGLKKGKVMSIEDLNLKLNSLETIIMMGNNFALFGSFKKAQRLLTRFYKMTSKNALIIAETRDPYKTDDPTYLEYYKFNKKKRQNARTTKGQSEIRKIHWQMV